MTFLSDEQLFWLEELPNSFVEVYSQPQGQSFVAGMTGKVVKIRDLDHYIKSHPLENLWRSWVIYEDASKSKSIGGLPAVVDIDDESDVPSVSSPPQSAPNLQKAYELTRICSSIIIEKWAKSENRVRIVFSGHKGFHLEFKPNIPADMKLIREEIIASCVKKGLPNTYNIFFGTTSIDTVKDEVRLSGSLNSWRNAEGIICSRRVVQLSLEEIMFLELDDIISKSELNQGDI